MRLVRDDYCWMLMEIYWAPESVNDSEMLMLDTQLVGDLRVTAER